MEYPASTLTAAQEGAHFDMRFRIAMQLAASLGFAALAVDQIGPANENPAAAGAYARLALNMAEEIVSQGEARGWVEPLETLDGELPQHEIDHVKRNARAGVISQVHQQEVMGELAPSVGVVRRGGFMGPQ